MMKIYFFPLLALLIFSDLSCARKKRRRPVNLPAPSERSAVLEEEKSEKPYVYQGAKNKNPFAPLIKGGGSGVLARRGGDLKEDAASSFDIDSIVLSGIMIDEEGSRYALLRGSGDSYTLRGRKLFDQRGRETPGVTGIALPDKVILIKGKKTTTLPIPK